MSISWRENAIKSMKSIAKGDPTLARQIRDAVVRYHDTGHGDIKALRGSVGESRLRIRRYRVVFEWAGDELRVLDVDKRSDVYRNR